jgi:hypothetical protein
MTTRDLLLDKTDSFMLLGRRLSYREVSFECRFHGQRGGVIGRPTVLLHVRPMSMTLLTTLKFESCLLAEVIHSRLIHQLQRTFVSTWYSQSAFSFFYWCSTTKAGRATLYYTRLTTGCAWLTSTSPVSKSCRADGHESICGFQIKPLGVMWTPHRHPIPPKMPATSASGVPKQMRMEYCTIDAHTHTRITLSPFCAHLACSNTHVLQRCQHCFGIRSPSPQRRHECATSIRCQLWNFAQRQVQ